MATRGPLGRGKRERERARVERQKQKMVKREEAKNRRGQTGSTSSGEDRDIAGIVPGPQANPWGDDPLLEEETTEDEEKDQA